MDDFTVASCVTICVVIYTIFSVIIKLGQRRYRFKQTSKFPGPPTLPFIGNAHLFTGNADDRIETLIKLGTSYPTPYRLWLGSYLIFIVDTPEQLKIVLNSPKTMEKGEFYYFIRPWLGTGLLSAPSTKWRVHRKLIQPTFSSTIVHSFIGVFVSRAAIIAEEFKRRLDGPEFDIYKYTSQYTLHAVCETTMGVNLGAQTNSNSYYAEAIDKVVDGVCRRIANPLLHSNFVFNRTKLGRDQQKYIKFLHAFTDNVIQKKKKELLERNHLEGSTDSDEDTGSWIPRRKVLLDHLLEVSRDSNKLSDEALREEVDTIMVAGSDTTAVTISFAMLMLASHPEIQDKVYQELCEIFGDPDNEELHVTAEDMTRMTYLERVIKETMRLFPISPFLTRSVTEDLEIGEHTFPAGSLVFLSMIELHRNKNVWLDPLKFDPDRFLPEEVNKRDSYAYLPFGGGPRNCLGSKYAMMSMKVLLATILHRYVLKKENIISVKDIRFKTQFLLRPVDPISLRIERRT